MLSSISLVKKTKEYLQANDFLIACLQRTVIDRHKKQFILSPYFIQQLVQGYFYHYLRHTMGTLLWRYFVIISANYFIICSFVEVFFLLFFSFSFVEVTKCLEKDYVNRVKFNIKANVNIFKTKCLMCFGKVWLIPVLL